MITMLGGQFDGKTYMAYMDANPDKALLQISNPMAAAQAFVDHEWLAKFDALPEPAKEKLKELKGTTEEDWNRGNFTAILKAAQDIPGLAEALVKIFNGASNNGNDWPAIIRAITDGSSMEAARRELAALTEARTMYITALVTRKDAMAAAGTDHNGAASGDGTPGFANGGILRSVRRVEDLFKGRFAYKAFANGGIERHVAQIASGRGPIRVWGEAETQGEAYIPYAQSKRPRSLAILTQVARDFGFELNKATEYASGGFAGHAGPSTTNSANVNIGNLYTVDADEAVRKIRTSQADALAVAGISLNGA
jgi:hypothetical protein